MPEGDADSKIDFKWVKQSPDNRFLSPSFWTNCFVGSRGCVIFAGELVEAAFCWSRTSAELQVDTLRA